MKITLYGIVNPSGHTWGSLHTSEEDAKDFYSRMGGYSTRLKRGYEIRKLYLQVDSLELMRLVGDAER